MNGLLDGLAAVRRSRSEVEALMADHTGDVELQQLGQRAVDGLTEWEEQVLQVEFETYEDEDSLPGRLVKQVRHLLDVIDDAGPPVAAGALERLRDLKANWAELQTSLRELTASELARLNRWAASNGVAPISDPTGN